MSGVIPGRIKKNWDSETRHAVIKDISIVVTTDLECIAMSVHIDVDDFIFGVAYVDMSAWKQAHRMLHKVVVIRRLIHDGHSRC